MSFFDIFRVGKIKLENKNLTHEVNKLKLQLEELGYTEYTQVKNEIAKINSEIYDCNKLVARLREEIESLNLEHDTKNKQLQLSTNRIAKNAEIIRAIKYAMDNECSVSSNDLSYIDELLPSVILKLNSMNLAELRKANTVNNKQIESLLTSYKARYTTKANQTIYALMVIALRAELQNILVDMKYEKLEKALDNIKKVTSKYLTIASDGNQSIAGTLTKFISEIEYLFINSIKIEYNYYVKKEQAKQEQLAIRAQMKQEAEERKALEMEKKKVEQEEQKFNAELAKVAELLNLTTSQDEADSLRKRLLELEAQLSNVIVKKEEILNLQNGKAGTVYIISNLGSFGENVFKVGMTRRLDPMDRVKELGDASVPFLFDVHSFIFSDDAVELEQKMHKILSEKRLNKVNRRKEFFNVSIDEIKAIVMELQPTAEFNETMIAEEFRQSLSSDTIYSAEVDATNFEEECD